MSEGLLIHTSSRHLGGFLFSVSILSVAIFKPCSHLYGCNNNATKDFPVIETFEGISFLYIGHQKLLLDNP